MTIREAMREADISREELSALLGAPIHTVDNWLKGRRMPADYVVRLIVAEILRNKKSGA